MVGLEPISDEDLAEVLTDLASLEPLMGDVGRPTWFELLTAAAFRYFADRPVDVAVVEVGMGGRWDATNIADGAVSIVTNVALDHTELLGPTREHIAGEKAGIVKAGATLVLCETDPALYDIFAAEHPETIWLAGRDFAVESNVVAVGGRLVDLRTPADRYEGVYLHLHGRYQADNFLDALVGAEAFFGGPLDHEIVAEAAATASSPGRLEVVAPTTRGRAGRGQERGRRPGICGRGERGVRRWTFPRHGGRHARRKRPGGDADGPRRAQGPAGRDLPTTITQGPGRLRTWPRPPARWVPAPLWPARWSRRSRWRSARPARTNWSWLPVRCTWSGRRGRC